MKNTSSRTDTIHDDREAVPDSKCATIKARHPSSDQKEYWKPTHPQCRPASLPVNTMEHLNVRDTRHLERRSMPTRRPRDDQKEYWEPICMRNPVSAEKTMEKSSEDNQASLSANKCRRDSDCKEYWEPPCLCPLAGDGDVSSQKETKCPVDKRGSRIRSGDQKEYWDPGLYNKHKLDILSSQRTTNKYEQSGPNKLQDNCADLTEIKMQTDQCDLDYNSTSKSQCYPDCDWEHSMDIEDSSDFYEQDQCVPELPLSKLGTNMDPETHRQPMQVL